MFSLSGVQTKKVRGEASRQCTSITGQLRGPPQSSGAAARRIKSARTQVISVSYPLSGACPQDVSHPKLQALQADVLGEVLRYVRANRGGSSGLGLALLDAPARFFPFLALSLAHQQFLPISSWVTHLDSYYKYLVQFDECPEIIPELTKYRGT